jgi:hypothetical protein
MSVSAARERVGPEIMSPFDSLTPLLCRLTVGFFRLSLTVQKFSTCVITIVNALWKFKGKNNLSCTL